MASPQKENGYTPIADEIMEALARTRIPGECRQVLDVILRKTYGWDKKNDEISLTQFSNMTRLSKVHVCRSLAKLEQMNLITKSGNAKSLFTKYGNDRSVTYGFQKDYEKWLTLPKKVTSHDNITKKGNVTDITNEINNENDSNTRTLPKKVTSKHVTKKGNDTLPNLGTTIDNTIDKKHIGHVANQIPFEEIISHLNEKSGKSFRNVDEHKRHISARWNDGFRLADFFAVIDHKAEEWKSNPKMQKYIRPETLFGTKFDGYLNECRDSGEDAYDQISKQLREQHGSH